MNIASGEQFSVIIVNYNSGPMLLDCVRSVIQEGVRAGSVIVVDNGSRDNSIATLKEDLPSVRIILNSCNAGFAAAVNQGLAVADRDFILLLNNDGLLQPGALQAFLDAFQRNPKLAIAGSQLRSLNGSSQTSIASSPTLLRELIPGPWVKLFSFRNRQSYDSAAPIAVECVLGACIAVRASILPVLDGLDEDYFFYFEEIEWCERAWRKGFDVFYVPEAKVLHLRGKTAGNFSSGAHIEYLRSKLTFYRKQRSRLSYQAVSFHMLLSALLNAASNLFVVCITGGLAKKARRKSKNYGHALRWHLGGRSEAWGLPEKCPRKPRA